VNTTLTKKAKLTLTGSILLLGILTAICFIYEPLYVNKSVKELLYLTGFLAAAIIPHIWFQPFQRQKTNGFLNVIIFFLGFIPVFIIMISLQNEQRSLQLAKFGIITYGKVSRTYTHTIDKSRIDMAEFYYHVSEQVLVREKNNDDHNYQLHDSLIIKYSSANPELIEIQEIWRNSKLVKNLNDEI